MVDKTIQASLACMEYCCHIWTGAPSCYLELLDKLQNTDMQDCWSFFCCLSWTLGSLLKCSHLKSFLYFGKCSSELDQLVPLPYFRGRSTHYTNSLHAFSVTIPRCYKDVYVNSLFPFTFRLGNSLSIECFPVIYDLNGFKSRINRHFLTVASFETDFLYAV